MKKNGKEYQKILNLQNKDSIRWMYESYGLKLYQFAICSWKIPEDDAWEEVYNTIFKVIKSFPSCSFNSENEFNAYVYRVFINNLKNLLLRKKKEIEQVNLPDFEFSGMDTQEDNSLSEQLGILEEELNQMEDWQRILLLLRSQGMPYKEIASFIEKPEEQLKTYYSRLKVRLEEKLKINYHKVTENET